MQDRAMQEQLPSTRVGAIAGLAQAAHICRPRPALNRPDFPAPGAGAPQHP